MKIYNSLIFCFLLAFTILFSGCDNESSKKRGTLKYYDIQTLIEKQIQILEKENARVSKTTELDGEKEVNTINDVNWQKELQPFIQADINKPAYVNSYSIMQPDSNTVIYTLTSKDNLLVRELIIKTDSTGKGPLEIKAKLHSQNQLYRSDRQIIASFSNGAFKSYSVEGFQKLAILPKRTFRIQATIL